MIALTMRFAILVLVGVGAFLLFGPPGILNNWLGADLGFLLVPLLVFVGLQLVALVLHRLLSVRFAILGWLVGTIGWGWLVFYLVDRLPAISALLADSQALPSAIADAFAAIADFETPGRARSMSLIAAGLLGIRAIHRWRRRHAQEGIPIAIWVALEFFPSVLSIGVVFLLLGRGWLLDSLFSLDLSTLVVPISIALLFSATGRIIGVLRPGRIGVTVSSLLQTISTMFIVGWVLYYLPTLAHRLGESSLLPDDLGGATDFLDRIWHWSYAIGGVCLAANSGLRRVFALWDVEQAPRWINLTAPAIRAGLTLVVGMVLRALFQSLSSTWEPAEGLSQVILWGTVAMVASTLLGYFHNVRHPLISGFAKWASGSQSKAFVLGGLAGAYFVFIRSMLFNAFQYAYALEWFIIAVVAWRLLTVVREESARVYTQQAQDMAYTEWKRHTQEIGTREDPQLSQAQQAMRWFITDGVKDELVVMAISVLTSRGLDRPQVARLTHDLVGYQDRPIPFLALPWEKRRIVQRNLDARRALLQQITHNLDLPQEDLEDTLAREGATT
jgi:hypothetical protein